LQVFYDQDAAAKDSAGKDTAAKSAPQPSGMKAAVPGPGGSSQIRRLEAKGGVIVTQKDQVVTGETGVFDMRSNTVTVSGGVVLTRAQDVLKGDRLIVNMTTGVSRIEMEPGRRVNVLINPKSDGAKGPSVPGMVPTERKDGPRESSKEPGKPLRLNAFPSNSGRAG
jgi:lipopolysaccharide export system protein LptA